MKRSEWEGNEELDRYEREPFSHSIMIESFVAFFSHSPRPNNNEVSLLWTIEINKNKWWKSACFI